MKAMVGVQGESEQGPVKRALPMDCCVLVIFGITGDLARRKLIPALYHLEKAGALPEKFAGVGVSRSVGEADALRRRLKENAAEFSRSKGIDSEVWDRFEERIHSVQGNVDDPDLYRRLDAKCRATGGLAPGGRTGGEQRDPGAWIIGELGLL